MAYEVLGASDRRKPAGRPMVSIQPSGSIRVNIEATQILKELGAERVLLMWDQDRRKIAITPAAKNDQRSFKLRYDPSGNGAQFAAKSLASRIGWHAEQSVRILIHQSGELLEGVLPAENLTRTRKKKPDG